jgi:hypothetical protein
MTAPTSIAGVQLGYDSSGSTNTYSGSWTINSGSMIAIIVVLNDGNRSVSSCTLAGQAMNQAISYLNGDCRTSIYYRLNPPVGSQSVAMSLNAAARWGVVGIQMGIVGGTGTAVGNGKSGNTITINGSTTLPDNILVCGGCCNSQGITLNGATRLASNGGLLRYDVGYISKPTAGSYTVTFGLTDTPSYGASGAVLPVVGIFGQQFRILRYPGS